MATTRKIARRWSIACSSGLVHAACKLAPVASHLPERAEMAVTGAAPAWPVPQAALFLLSHAEPADVLALVPEGPPQRFRWRGVTMTSPRPGTERIASEWWRSSRPTRDYYLVEDDDGRRFWLYRETLRARDQFAALVRARAICVRSTAHDRLRRACRHHQFFLPTGAPIPPRWWRPPRRSACRHRDCRPQQLRGVVRAYEEWRKRKAIKLIVGTRLVTVDGFEVITYPTDRASYGRLCRLLSDCNRKLRKGEKGECQLTFEDILAVSAAA
jgi:hypothetical protein